MTGRSLPLAVVLATLAAALLGATPAPASQISDGKHLFGQYCVMCHGANGSGIPGSATRVIGSAPLLSPAQQRGTAPSLRGVGAMAADFYLRTGYMPLSNIGDQPRRSFRVRLSNREISALTAYVASLGPGPSVPHPDPARGNLSEGLHLFTEHCAGCHQVVAEGGYVTGAVPPPLGQATPVQVAEAVRIGPYVMPRFSRKAISDRQLDSIVRYVQYAKSPDDRGGLPLGHVGPVPEGIVSWLVAAAVLVAVCVAVGKRVQRVV